MNNNMNNQQEIILNPKKSGGRKAAVIAAAAVCIVGIGAGIAIGVPSVNNSLKMALSSPEDYYSGVVRNAVSKSSDKLSKNYTAYCDKINSDTAYKGSFSITPGPAVLEEILLEERGVNGEDWNFALDYTICENSGKTDSAIDMTFSLNSNPLFDVNSVVSSDTLYMAIPTISDKWLYSTTDELKEYLGADSELTEAENITLYDGTVLTNERVNAIAARYTDIYLAHTGDVTLNKKVEVTSASGIASKYTEAVVSFDAETAKTVIEEVIAAVKSDEDIKAIWLSLGISEEEYTEMLNEMTAEDEYSPFDVRTYITSDGSIAGIKLTCEDTEASYMYYSDENKFAVESGVYNDENSFKFVTDGELNGTLVDGSGTVEISEKTEYYDDSYSISFTYDELDAAAMKDGNIVGNITVDFALDEEDKASINLIGKKDYSEATVKCTIENEDAFTIFVSCEETEYKAIEVPQGSVKLTDDAAMRDYITSADYSRLKSNINAISGIIGKETADILIEALDSITMYADEVSLY